MCINSWNTNICNYRNFLVMTKNNVYINYVLHHKATFRKSSNEGYADRFVVKEKFESYIRCCGSFTVPGAMRSY